MPMDNRATVIITLLTTLFHLTVGTPTTLLHRDIKRHEDIQNTHGRNIGTDFLNPHHQPVIILPKTSYCSYNNQTYESGDKFQPDACTFCHCPKHNNRVQCSIQDCKFQPNCVRYSKLNSKDCCGQCVEIGCKYTDSRLYRPNEVILDTNCERCFCPAGGGRVQCTKRVKCPIVNCVDLVKNEDDCCERCHNGPNCWLGDSDVILPAGRAYHVSECRICQCPHYPLPFWMRGKKIQAVCSNICVPS